MGSEMCIRDRKRSEKYANFTKELVNAGIVLGSVDEDLGVILSE